MNRQFDILHIYKSIYNPSKIKEKPVAGVEYPRGHICKERNHVEIPVAIATTIKKMASIITQSMIQFFFQVIASSNGKTYEELSDNVLQIKFNHLFNVSFFQFSNLSGL